MFDCAQAKRPSAKVSGIPDAALTVGVDRRFPDFYLRVIWIYFQVGKENWLSRRLLASAIRFNRYEYRVNLVQRFLVGRLCDPTPLRGVVFIEHTELVGLLPVRSAAAPGFKRARFLHARRLVQVIGVENQRFAPREEHAPERLLRFACADNVVDLRDIKVPCAHQLSNVAILGEHLLLLGSKMFLLCK